MPSDLEIVHSQRPRGPFRAALFDFDGTLSLLRQNWQAIMVPMMVSELLLNSDPERRDSPQEIEELVSEFVARLTGKQTIYQMMRLAEEVQARGGRPAEPLHYKHRYHDLLWTEVKQRIDAVTDGRMARSQMMVAGAEDLLQALQQHGCTLYLASGTDLHYVKHELSVLGLEHYFGPHVYGALDDYRRFSKAQVIQRIVQEAGAPGTEILGVGDGFVEIEEVQQAGGLALGVASQEDGAPGVNAWKRDRLIQAGAHAIVPDYKSCREWLPALLSG